SGTRLVGSEMCIRDSFKANKKPLKAFDNLYQYMLDLLSHEHQKNDRYRVHEVALLLLAQAH
ncbi:hypothetical protein ACRTEU_24640, partial [Vibrio alginolyticus]